MISTGSIQIGIVGPGSAISRAESRAAYEVGALLANASATIICGGTGGVMESACRGAIEAGGTTVGVLPGGDMSEGNAWLTVSLPTGMGEMRNVLVVRGSAALICIGGSWGTLSEVAIAVRTRTPIVGIGGWSVATSDGQKVKRHPPAVETPAEAVRWAINRARSSSLGRKKSR